MNKLDWVREAKRLRSEVDALRVSNAALVAALEAIVKNSEDAYADAVARAALAKAREVAGG
jgi:hypothetical protein